MQGCYVPRGGAPKFDFHAGSGARTPTPARRRRALWSSGVADAVAAVTALATPENLAAWEQPDAEARDEDEGPPRPGGEEAGGGRRNS